jgi:adenosine deaminase
MSSDLYHQDYYQWIQETVKLLEQRNFQELDLDNLIEEIQDLALNEKQTIETNLIVVLKLLLKWQYQPEQRSGEIKASIRRHRYQIRDDLKVSPSLKTHLSEIWLESYQEARQQAADETQLAVEIFTEQCPYTIENLLNTDYLP